MRCDQRLLSGGLALTGEVRGNIYSSGASDTFPYKSGVMVLLGIEFRGSQGKKEESVEPLR